MSSTSMSKYLRIYMYKGKFSIWPTPPQPSELKTRYSFEMLPTHLQEAIAMLDLTAPDTVVSDVGYRRPRQADGAQLYFIFYGEK
jgi:hypothetical protein